MKRIFKTIIIPIYISLLIVAIISISYFSHQIQIDWLFNSDSLHLAVLFDDIFVNNGDFFAWHLTPAPYFFPDMLLFFGVRSLTSNTYYSFWGYALIQILLTYVVAILIIQGFSSNHKSRNGLKLIFSSLFLSIISYLVIKSIAPYYYSLISLYRFGTVLNGLILISIVLYYIKKPSKLLAASTLAYSAIGMSSDLLFLAMAVIPACLSAFCISFFRKLDRKQAIVLTACIATGAVLGLSLKALVTVDVTSAYIYRESINVFEQLGIVFSSIYYVAKSSVLFSILTLLFYIIAIAKTPRQLTLQTSESQLYCYLVVFLVLSPLITICAIALRGILFDLGPGNVDFSRYFLNLYWFPILFSWLVFYDLKLKLPVLNSALAICSLFSIYQIFPIASFQLDYYPAMAKCLDNEISRFEDTSGIDISRGIGQYWHAKFFSQFSKKQLSILQVYSDLTPQIWINNPDWYESSTYDFALVSLNDAPGLTLNKDLISDFNGEPVFTSICREQENGLERLQNSASKSRDFEILIYGHNKMRTRLFDVSGDRFVWQACELPTQVGKVREESCVVEAPADSLPGFLTYGPYVQLSSGTYDATIRYETDDDSEGKVIGEWDIVTSLGNGRNLRILDQGDLLGSSEISQVSTSFQLPSELDGYKGGYKVEVRTQAQSQSTLRIIDLVIEKRS